MYRSEDIGARKQSAGRRVGKNFPSPMEMLHGISHDHDGLRKNRIFEWKHGGLGKKQAGSAIGAKKEFPDEKVLCVWTWKKNGRRQCIGVKTSGPENNPPGGGSAKTFLHGWKSCPCQRCVF